MENLHSDILENILLGLEIEAALHAERVCTTWRAILRCKTDKQGFLFKSCHEDCGSQAKEKYYYPIIRTELFYADVYDQTKIKHYYPPNIPTALVGSCNGLVCFGKYHEFDMGTIPSLICNPLTGESMVLPINYSEFPLDISNTGRNYSSYSGSLSSGFGYCPSTNEYKVVTIFHPFEEKAHVQVYTVGGGWRYIGFIDRYESYRFNCCSGVLVLYWLHISHPSDVRLQECEVMAFDLESETFDYIPLPGSNYNDFENLSIINSPLKLLGGNNNLYLVHTNYKASGTDICVYKKNNISTGGGTSYANKESNRKVNYQSESSSHWIKEFGIRLEEKAGLIPFAITTRNEILLSYKRYVPVGKRLYCYDPKTSTLDEFWDDDKAFGIWVYIDAVPHRHSIVSLKDLGVTNVTSLKDL